MVKNTDFVILGTFLNHEADLLKQELEKVGITTKLLYPGTSIGREAYAGTGWTSYTLLIRECDIERANAIKDDIGIEVAETIPFIPTTRSIGNKKTIKIWAIIGILSFIIGMILGIFSISNYFSIMLIVFSIISLTVVGLLSFIPKKEKYEQSNQENDTNRR